MADSQNPADLHESTLARPITEKEAASLMLREAARRMNESFAPFSAWLIAGIGASLSLVVINLDKVLTVVGKNYLRAAIILLVGALLIGAVAKLMSGLLSGLIAASMSVGVHARIKATPNFQRDLLHEEMAKASGRRVKTRGALERDGWLFRMARTIAYFILVQVLLTSLAVLLIAAGLAMS